MKRYFVLAIGLAAIFLGACSNESSLPEAKGEANVRAINAIQTSPPLSFLIEERLIASVDYKNATTTATYDDLEYTFNFEFILLGGLVRTRVASQFVDVEADKDYTFVASGTIAAPLVTVWETDVREWDGTETVFEVSFSHLAETLGDVDVYLAPPGVAPVLGSEQGTLSFTGITPGVDLEAEELVMTITAAGDPAMVRFESEPFTTVARTSLNLSVFDGDANDVEPVSVRLINLTSGGGGVIRSVNTPSVVRFFHTSFNFGNADIYVDDPLGTPVVTNHVFRDVTGDIEVPPGDLPLTYTDVGNIGALLIDVDRTVVADVRTNYYVLDDGAGNNAIVAAILDRRPVETFARLSFMNTSTNHSVVDFYVIAVPEPGEPDVSIDEVPPLIPDLPLGAAPFGAPLSPGSYDVYITAPDEKTVITGPVRLDVAASDVLDVIIYDNVDPLTADVVFIPYP